MAKEGSKQKRRSRRGLTSDENGDSGLKSPFKLLSPIVHTKTIHLHDWWLLRPEGGEGIAVGGFTFRREGVVTSFCSASIKERHDSSTIESSDGITIFISGFINRYVAEQNGFSPEVCSHFVHGFPYNWDDFASQHVPDGSTRPASHTMSPDASHTFPPNSFQEMTFLQKRDLLLSSHGIYEEDAISEHISNDLWQKIKNELASSIDDTNDCNLPNASKSKEFQEMGKCRYSSQNGNGIRTRSKRFYPRNVMLPEEAGAKPSLRPRRKTRG